MVRSKRVQRTEGVTGGVIERDIKTKVSGLPRFRSEGASEPLRKGEKGSPEVWVREEKDSPDPEHLRCSIHPDHRTDLGTLFRDIPVSFDAEFHSVYLLSPLFLFFPLGA